MRYTLIAIFIISTFCITIFAQSSILLITATNDVVNGDITNPSTLIENPGQDGISIREAILATNSLPGPHLIMFDLILKGIKIILKENLPIITKGPITIVGDVDGDLKPDITFESKGASSCFNVSTSDVTLKGFIITNFFGAGIEVTTGQNDAEPKFIGGISLERNEITVSGNGISVTNSDQFCTISDVEIRQNTIIKNRFAINIQPASFQSGWERLSYKNKIEDISVINNVISENEIAIYASGAIRAGSKDNSISGLTISNNNISKHTNVALLINGGNSIGIQNNRIEGLILRDNIIDGKGATIEILGGANGGDDNFPSEISRDVRANKVSNIKIIGNKIRGGGIQFVGTDMWTFPSEENIISNVLIEKNIISYCDANGIFFICGGSGTAKNNSIDTIKIIDNLIIKNKDAGILFIGGYRTAFNNVIRKADVINNTIVGNGTASPLWAGGINFEFNKESSGNLITGVEIINTILWANAGNDYIRGPNTPDSVQFSIIGDSRYKNKNNNFYQSPLFVNSENFDFQLEKTSPAIDRGDPNTATVGNTDLLGNNRIVDGNNDEIATIDIGAIEYDPNITGMLQSKENEIPLTFLLYQNYPNPFNLATSIFFNLPTRSFVSLKVYDTLGKEVATIISDELLAGNHSLQWNAANITSGVYFYRLQVGNYCNTKKLLLLK